MKKENVLLLENIHQSGVSFLNSKGCSVYKESAGLGEKALTQRLNENKVFALGIRSKTQVTEEVVQSSKNLRAIGAFCIGTNQINLKACALKGVPVFNAPYSNTRSVAELVICEIVALSRKLTHVSSLLHQGVWQKKAVGSFEVRGKTLGVIGYGHIGSQVGILAESLGLKVCYYDISAKLPLGNAYPSTSLEELLKKSDFVSLHVPETEETKNMFGREELQKMKKGSYLINASRGSVVDIQALAEKLKSYDLAGAAIDVYPKEPKANGEGFESELLGLDNVILTPHIGGSTEEAQEAIGKEVSLSLYSYMSLGDTMGAVNFPKIRVPKISKDCVRLCHAHLNKPGVLGEVNAIFSSLGLNIAYQSLATLDEVGYLIIDFKASTLDEKNVLLELSKKNFSMGVDRILR